MRPTPVPTPTPPANWNATSAPFVQPSLASASVDVTFAPVVDAAPSVALGEGQPAAQAPFATLRVIDDPQPQGLLESILGDVARAFGL